MRWLGTRILPIPALIAADPALIFAYRYWHNLKQDDRLAPRCRLDTPQFRLIVPEVAWIDLRGAAGVPEAVLDLGPLRPLADVPPAADADDTLSGSLGPELQAALGVVACTGTPLFQLIELCCGEAPLSFQQLVLPLADDGARPSELLHLCRRGGLNIQSGLLHGAV